MATLALAAVGSAVGGALLPGGVSLLGLTLGGATLGAQAGAIAGSVIDRSLLAASASAQTSGPRLSDLRVMTASEGAPIPRLYGRARLGGQVIWAADFTEEASTTGGSGKGGASTLAATSTTTYRYYASFAVALCEGPITSLGRIWADGTPLDLANVTYRLHKGSEDQQPDSLMEAALGSGNVPAYRGLAYVVFEHLPIADYGNRLPQLSFEVFRSVDSFERKIRSVTLIPGAGEFALGTQAVSRRITEASAASENVHTVQGGTDFSVALDQLQETLPNVGHVSLTVGWFGTDLRAEHCGIVPGVDSADKTTSPVTWSVAGLTREAAHIVSLHEGRAAYGGTPSDASVISAIQDLKARGLAVTLSPFLFMDVPADNELPDPYRDGATQPAYPWRGRITVTPDGVHAAASAIASFVGTAAPSDFAIADGRVVYSGPDEWSYRRFILHNAALCLAGGGVDAFVIGSEMRGLTQVRSASTAYPFVDALVALAADVKAMLGDSKVTYAADWSEYFGHHPADAPADTIFNLDPLWASPDIDAVGVDVYWPLADWRDGSSHRDSIDGTASTYDLDYLRGNIFGGEGYDWYYASSGDRTSQTRTPITDGAGKPWLYRFKDVRAWWSSAHHNRVTGVDAVSSTAWVPQSKPIWFTELGCSAVDKGANQPNVFVDAKSSETALPYFSRGTRDDFMQRRYLEAFHTGLDPDDEGYLAGANPLSTVTGARMIALERLTVYTWDARPWPAFPTDTETWGDAANYRLGHWINGRLASAPVERVIAALLRDYGFDAFAIGSIPGTIGGLVIDRVMSARDALGPLLLAAFVDVRESEGRLVFSSRGHAPVSASLSLDDLVETRASDPLAKLIRGQESDLPASAKLAFISGDGSYSAAIEEARRSTGGSTRVATADLGLVLEPEQAAQMAETWLFEAWASRERARFALPPSRLALEPGDVLTLDDGARTRALRLTEIGDHGARDVEALSIDRDVYAASSVRVREANPESSPIVAGPPLVRFLDLPLLSASDSETSGYLAVAQEPWPGTMAIFRSPEASGFALAGTASLAATTGRTLDALAPAPSGRVTALETFRVQLDRGALSSASALAFLGGANLAAIANDDGDWEILQFREADLVAPRTYRLSGFLRGQGGTEAAMRSPVAAGAPFVLLDTAIQRLDLAPEDIGLDFNWRIGPARRSLGDASCAALVHAFEGIGRRPLSPVHLRCARASNGDANLTWVRRTRIGGDTWDGLDVPLAEAQELYAVDVYADGHVVRSLSATTPSLVYSAEAQAADLGTVPATLDIAVAQVSATFGRGIATRALI